MFALLVGSWPRSRKVVAFELDAGGRDNSDYIGLRKKMIFENAGAVEGHGPGELDAGFAGLDGEIELELVRLAQGVGSAADRQTAGSAHIHFDFALGGGGELELESAAVGIVPGCSAVVLVDEAFGDLHVAVGRRFEDEEMLLDLRGARRLDRLVDRDVDAERRNAGSEGLVVLDAVVDGLQEKRATADAGLDVLCEDELALGVGLDAAEVLRTLIRGLVERDGGAWLRLAGGGVEDETVDGGVGLRNQQ